jgi:hypothetical protein
MYCSIDEAWNINPESEMSDSGLSGYSFFNDFNDVSSIDEKEIEREREREREKEKKRKRKILKNKPYIKKNIDHDNCQTSIDHIFNCKHCYRKIKKRFEKHSNKYLKEIIYVLIAIIFIFLILDIFIKVVKK